MRFNKCNIKSCKQLMSIEKIKVCIQVNGRISFVANKAHAHTHKQLSCAQPNHDVEKIKERERESIHSRGFVSIFASDQ